MSFSSYHESDKTPFNPRRSVLSNKSPHIHCAHYENPINSSFLIVYVFPLPINCPAWRICKSDFIVSLINVHPSSNPQYEIMYKYICTYICTYKKLDKSTMYY